MSEPRAIPRIVAGFLALVAAFSAERAFSQTNNPDSQALPLRARGLIGMDVEDKDGQDMGKVRDFAVSTRTGKLQYVIISSGGFFGIGARLKAVPPQIVSAATAKRNTLVLESTRSRWKSAPTFRASDLATLAQPDRIRQIYRFYGQAPPAASESRGPTPASPLSPTGKPTRTQARKRPVELKLASDLIGDPILDRGQERIGSVMDLLMAFDEDTPVFVLYSAGRLFRDHEHYYAIPFQDVTLVSSSRIAVPADRQTMEAAAPFNEKTWTETGTNQAPSVFRYSLTD